MYLNSIIYFLSSIVTVLVNFLSLPFFTRYLSLADYGIIALFVIYGTIFGSILSFGLGAALDRFYFKYKKNEFRIIFTTINFSLLIIYSLSIIIIIFFIESLSKYLFENKFANFLLLASLFNGIILIFYQNNKSLIINLKKPKIFAFL